VFDVFTETVDDDTWSFRRDHRISRPADDLIVVPPHGVPMVRPPIQLLYMASSKDPKNDADFAISRPRLDAAESVWLADSLATTLPEHRWLADL
jgi:hypothetical protein